MSSLELIRGGTELVLWLVLWLVLVLVLVLWLVLVFVERVTRLCRCLWRRPVRAAVKVRAAGVPNAGR